MVSWSPVGGTLLLTLTLLAATSAATASTAVLTPVPPISSSASLPTVTVAATYCCHLRLILRCERREGFVEVGCCCSGAGSCAIYGYRRHGHLFRGHIHFVSRLHHCLVAGCRKLHVADVGSDIHWEGHEPYGFGVTGTTAPGKLSRLLAYFIHYLESQL